MDRGALTRFIFELGQLRRVKHEGIRLAGVDHPPSVAEHTLRAAQIGFVLAKMERYGDPHEVCTILLFHDLAETRTGDVHRLGRRYVEVDEERAVKEQTGLLGEIGTEVLNLWQQAEHRSSLAGILARDADQLEQAFAAKEYLERGYTLAADWIKNVSRVLRTESAKMLLEEMQKTNSTDWWQGLKKLSEPAPDHRE
jgi:putative hydrolase of HD superfamily